MNNGIWSVKTASRKHKCDIALADTIGSIYPIQMSMADLGCGIGSYCKILRDKYQWQNVIGYEGTVGVSNLQNAYDKILFCDLTKEIELIRPFQMVLCLEVGEHIPKEFEQVFLNNVTKMSGNNLIISWAYPGQGGTGHVNELDQNYVYSQLTQRGFEIDNDKTHELRIKSEFKWFRKNIMAMRRIF